MLEILATISTLICGLLIIGLVSIVLKWSFKWFRRILRIALFTGTTIFIVHMYISALFIPMISEFSASKSLLPPISLALLVLLIPVIPLIRKASLSSDSTILLLKNNLEINNKRSYLSLKANSDAWYFSLYSIVISVVILTIQALITKFGPLIIEGINSDLSHHKLIIILFFLVIALLMCCLVQRYKRRPYEKDTDMPSYIRVYGLCVISFNYFFICIFTLLCYPSYSRSLPYSSVSSILSFIVLAYFYAVNISTFLCYGYDNGTAWLFETPEERMRKNSNIKIGTHWAQKLATTITTQSNIAQKLRKRSRMPELILHWQSAFGGAIGAYAGHWFFNHKKMFLLFRDKSTVSSESALKFAPVYERIVFSQIVQFIVLMRLREYF